MDTRTLPQRSDPTEQIALAAIAASRAGLTIREIQATRGGRQNIRQASLRDAVATLVAEDILDTEQPSRGLAIYFLPGQRPRPCVKIVPAAQVRADAHARAGRLPKSSWCSALGVAA